MNNTIWQWLEIEPTNDEAEIKKAYAKMSKKYHPVEFPEEFQELRKSYKQALSIAKLKKTYEEEPDAYGDELDEESVSELEQIGSEGKDQENYQFNIEHEDHKEENHKSNEKSASYQFQDYLDNRLTPPQIDLYNIVKRFCELVKQKPAIYGQGMAVNLLMADWDKEPIRQYLTAELVAEFIDLFSQITAFNKSMIKALDKKLIQGRKGAEFDGLKTRLFNLYDPDIVSQKKYKYELGYDDVTRLFIKVAEAGAYPDYMGFIFPRGIWRIHRVRFVLSTTYLYVIDAMATRCYLLRDTSFDINEKTGRLTIRRSNGKKIISFPVYYVDYQAMLTMLLRSTSKMTGEIKANKINMLMPYEPDKKGRVKLFSSFYFWGKEVYNLKAFIFCLLMTFISLKLMPLYKGLPDWNVPLMVFRCIGILSFLVFAISSIMAVVTGCWIISYLFSFLKIKAPVRKALKDDILNGRAQRTANADANFFEDYMITIDKMGLHLISYIDIKNCTRELSGPNNKKARLIITKVAGGVVEYSSNLIGVLDDLLRLINNKKKSCINRNKEDVFNPEDKESIHAHYYKKLSSKKHLRPSQYLLNSDIGAVYIGEYMLLIVLAVIGFGAFCVSLVGENMAQIFGAYAAVFIMLLFCIASISCIRSFLNIPEEYKLDAMIQTIYPDVYKSDKFAVFVCDDYLIFIVSGHLSVYRYHDLEWVSSDGYVKEKKGGNIRTMCLVSYSMTQNYELMADAMRNIVRAIKEKCPDMKVVKKGKLYDSWNRSGNDK